ncbi:hypothetical protein ppKF707_5792 [Metapseudomonas furukawaii]|uniref:Uncharacterized protein n=1 Tax=Metapseudomonas furukawaii TaxID=1149133 RepID=A0AAD1BWH0_METFU|nr:hypothetical protein ppKF707_5792 [Pseudomonas furukawaii]BAU72856.1 hypothetical protein KF707C_11680 [Pseudomonas furukawaii]
MKRLQGVALSCFYHGVALGLAGHSAVCQAQGGVECGGLTMWSRQAGNIVRKD